MRCFSTDLVTWNYGFPLAGGIAGGGVGAAVGGVVGAGVFGVGAALVADPLVAAGLTRIRFGGFFAPLAVPAAAGLWAPLTSALISGGKLKMDGSTNL